MPIYEYVCRECKAEFEQLVYASDTPECPSCGSVELSQQMSVTAPGVVKGAAVPPAPACARCPGRDSPGCPMD